MTKKSLSRKVTLSSASMATRLGAEDADTAPTRKISLIVNLLNDYIIAKLR